MKKQKAAVIALIPARSGSRRILEKNIKHFNGHPLIAYSIAAAIKSNVFDRVVVSTDSNHYASIAKHYGAEVPFLRPKSASGSKSPDIEWVTHALDELGFKKSDDASFFSILRPTSPFRTARTIRRAWEAYKNDPSAHSLRAVELVKQHPGKVWSLSKNRITPLLNGTINGQPWHSSQYAALPSFYVQNASLEIARINTVFRYKTIAGHEVMPFITKGFEGFDINTNEDWILAEHFLKNDNAQLPSIDQKAFSNKHANKDIS